MPDTITNKNVTTDSDTNLSAGSVAATALDMLRQSLAITVSIAERNAEVAMKHAGILEQALQQVMNKQVPNKK